MKVLNKHAPEKLIKKTPKNLKTPWMNNGLKQILLKRKLKLTYYQNKCVEF